MSIFEFDQEKYDAALREEGYDRGRAEGRAEGHQAGLEEGHQAGRQAKQQENIISLLEDLGEVPEEVSGSVYAQKETAVLDKWLKYAARAQSIGEFVEKCIL